MRGNSNTRGNSTDTRLAKCKWVEILSIHVGFGLKYVVGAMSESIELGDQLTHCALISHLVFMIYISKDIVMFFEMGFTVYKGVGDSLSVIANR